MKKLLSLFLVLTMIFACTSLVACSDDKSGDEAAAEDAATASNPLANAIDKFVGGDDAMGNIVYEALMGGSMKVHVGLGEYDLGADVGDVEATFYFDGENFKLVTDAYAEIEGEELSALMFVDKSGLALISESIFGNDDALAVNFETFLEEFEDSWLAEQMGDDSAVDTMMETLQTVVDTLNNKEGLTLSDDAIAAIEAVGTVFEVETSEEEVKNADGDKVACTVYTVAIDNDTVIELAEKLVDVVDVLADELDLESMLGGASLEDMMGMDLDEIPDMLEDALDEAEVEIDVTLAAAVDETNTLVSATVEGVVEAMGEEISSDVALLFSENAIILEGTVEAMGEEHGAALTIEKEDSADELAYTMSLDIESDAVGGEYTPFVGEFLYNKEDGEFELSLVVDSSPAEYDEVVEIFLTGALEMSEDSFKLAITEVGAAGVSIELDAWVEFNASAEMPAFPEDARDIIDFDEDDWMEIYEGIMDSDLGDLIASFENSEGEYEY